MDVKKNSRIREIGPWGTAARMLVGAAALVSAYSIGLTPRTAALGAIVIPAATILAMLLRGRHAGPLRAHAAYWHCVNIGIGVLLFTISPPAAFFFYGLAMLVAAWRGFGACELLSISNLV
ncbi:MAG TPA: hypothetical protein VFA34_12470, partial [Actinomycetota bacterium]|nr:hypothetical protein [Actinomycetota bacterium]